MNKPLGILLVLITIALGTCAFLLNDIRVFIKTDAHRKSFKHQLGFRCDLEEFCKDFDKDLELKSYLDEQEASRQEKTRRYLEQLREEKASAKSPSEDSAKENPEETPSFKFGVELREKFRRLKEVSESISEYEQRLADLGDSATAKTFVEIYEQRLKELHEEKSRLEKE